MKKIIALALSFTVGSCAVDKNILTKTEMTEWGNQNDTIFHKQIPIAVFTHYEVELYKGDRTNELCIQQINDNSYDITNLIRYVHTVHPKDKVQISTMYSRLKNPQPTTLNQFSK
jgi:hypothetical protein